jgi:hypothetical protein
VAFTSPSLPLPLTTIATVVADIVVGVTGVLGAAAAWLTTAIVILIFTITITALTLITPAISHRRKEESGELQHDPWTLVSWSWSCKKTVK